MLNKAKRRQRFNYINLIFQILDYSAVTKQPVATLYVSLVFNIYFSNTIK